MPRFAEHEPIYRAFNQFVERCLLDNKSVLWPDKTVWTKENVAEIKRRFVDDPRYGTELSFTQKLQQQFEGASSDLWRLLADIYYLYYLPSMSLTIQGKRAAIGWVVEQSGGENPTADASAWKVLEIGFARTGQRYHLKFPQFRLIMIWALQIKETPEILSDHRAMQRVLDDINQKTLPAVERAQDMRNALLYMTFPDYYEPTLSGTDKKQLLQTYGSRVIGGLPIDTDEAILKIRETLSFSLQPSELPFSFYGAIKDEWKSDKKYIEHQQTTGKDNLTIDVDEIEEIEETIIPETSIFISYRRKDSAGITGRIYDKLVEEFSEERVFKDVDSIPLGVDFVDYLSKEVARCNVLLAIVGDRWLTMVDNVGRRRLDDPLDFVRIEIEAALNRGIPVIPVLVEEAQALQQDALPPSLQKLARMQNAQVRHDPDFRRDMSRLVTELKRILKEK